MTVGLTHLLTGRNYAESTLKLWTTLRLHPELPLRGRWGLRQKVEIRHVCRVGGQNTLTLVLSMPRLAKRFVAMYPIASKPGACISSASSSS